MATAIFDDTSVDGSNAQRGSTTALNARKFSIAAAKVIKYYKMGLTQYSASGNCRVSIYSHNSGTDLPDTLVTGSDVVKACSTITQVTITTYQLDVATPPTLEAGTYWLVQDDNGEGSGTYAYAGIYTGANDGIRKLVAGGATTSYTWDWGVWADDPVSFVPFPLSSRGARGGLLVPSGGLQ